MPGQRKSTNQHVLQGTFRADRHALDCQGVPTEKPRCPSWLSKLGKRKWSELVDELYREGLRGVLDADALANYAHCWSELQGCLATIETDGRWVKGQRGGMTEHPASRASRQWLGLMQSWAAKLGLSLRERKGIAPSVEPVKQEARVPFHKPEVSSP
ncbi:MAG: phage terminase small subunit P27 family [Gemmataceae bacterium]